MGDVFCPIDSNKSTCKLIPEQSKCSCDKGQASGNIDEQDDGHSAFDFSARIDVSG